MTTTEAPGRGIPFRVEPRRTLPYRLARATAELLVRSWFRPDIHGSDKFPARGPVIVAPVHRSNTDFCFPAAVTDRKLFFMAKDSLWRSKAFGRFLMALGAFPVHRGSADREAMGHAESALRAGQVLLMFPEGSRQEGPEVRELLDGVAFLAARTGAAIVPLGIAGSDVAMPKGSHFPKPLRITLVVGEPLDPPGRTAGGRVARSTVHRTTVELRAAIQQVYDEAQRIRDGVRPG